MDKKKILLTILIVATVGFICCVGIVVYYYGSLNKQQNEYEKLAEQAKQTAEVSTEKADEDIAKEYVSPIDFDMLCNEKNDDIYAWIKVEGTKIDYPVLQHPKDNTYYVIHNIDDSYGYPGCIFTELYNNKDFEDPLTAMYGHYMKDGSMFAGLHNFMDKDFFDKHGKITVYTPEKEMEYEVFAAFMTDNNRITVWYDFDNEDTMTHYLEEVYSKEQNDTDHIKTDIKVNAGDKILALETCVDEGKDFRYLVLAVRK